MKPEPSTPKAALWMAGSITCFLVMSVAGRALAPHLDVFQVLEMRSLIGLLMIWPLIRAEGGFGAMLTGRPLMHVGRNVAHYAGQYAWFYALALIPLAELISIEFTMPCWAAILAVLFLRERLSAAKAGAIVLGLVGVLVIVRPGVNEMNPGHVVILFGAFMFAISIVMVKAMTSTENAVSIIFWMLIIQSMLGLVPAIQVWRTPSPDLLPWIVLVAFTGTFSHYCLARALSHADTMVVTPIDFLRVPFSALIGWMLYDEAIDAWVAAGAALILFGNLLNLQRRTTKPAPAELP
ncbi:MAG: DMT family transporter [Rhizobiaceae bacterium]